MDKKIEELTEEEILKLQRKAKAEYNREWRYRNHEKCLAYEREWREKNKDKVKRAKERYWAKRALQKGLHKSI